MSQVKLICSYDGTKYLGWQKTKMGKSIEETLEKTLSQILDEKIALQAASRTDAGVHSIGQVVSFYTPKSLDLAKLQKGLNSLLPKDISISHAETVPESFHPTLDSLGKEYHYDICFGKVQAPFYRAYSWHFFYPLDFEKMRSASKHLIGTHDFSAFCNQRIRLRENKIRTIFSIDMILISEDRLQIRIRGNSFLYKMVRNIVGTLLYIGSGKLEEGCIPDLLLKKDRKLAGMTAPAHGLFLKEVFYPNHL